MTFLRWFFLCFSVTFLSACSSNVTTDNESVKINKLDMIAPVITLKSANSIDVIKGEHYIDAGATAIDDRDGRVEVTRSGSVKIAKIGEYRITYTAKDNAGNSTSITRVVNVIPSESEEEVASVGTAYQYVTPSDVGVKIGVGVTNAIPTKIYKGPKKISSPTLIENKVIEGCLTINSDNVTIRNSIINCEGYYPVRMDKERSNLKIEYSKIACNKLPGKIFFFTHGAPNTTISHNEIKGCEDFFFIEGNLEGMLIKNNYMHSNIGKPSSHSDGFQIGEFTKTTGKIHIQGNYFEPKSPEIPKTALIFATKNSEVNLLMEDNYIEPFGTYAIRCTNKTKCVIKHNVFAQAFAKNAINLLLNQSSESVSFICNRYANGKLVKQRVKNRDVLSGVKHKNTNCPRRLD